MLGTDKKENFFKAYREESKSILTTWFYSLSSELSSSSTCKLYFWQNESLDEWLKDLQPVTKYIKTFLPLSIVFPHHNTTSNTDLCP